MHINLLVFLYDTQKHQKVGFTFYDYFESKRNSLPRISRGRNRALWTDPN